MENNCILQDVLWFRTIVYFRREDILWWGTFVYYRREDVAWVEDNCIL